MIDWLFAPRHHRPLPEETRQAQERADVRREAMDLVAEIKAFVADVQEAGADERKGYPVEHALRRRRPTP